MSGREVGFFSLDKAKGAPMFTKMPEDNNTSIESGATTGAINPPDLTSGLKPRCSAIKDARQARQLITTLEVSRREQNIKNARIMSKYNAERPYTQAALEADGLAWKSNFTTKPLPLLVDKVAPHVKGFVHVLAKVTAVTAPQADGSFAFKDVPAGKYTLLVFRGGAEVSSQEIDVGSSGSVNLETVSVEFKSGK